eukprot:7240868-Prorocentrum_lima.AAC.1
MDMNLRCCLVVRHDVLRHGGSPGFFSLEGVSMPWTLPDKAAAPELTTRGLVGPQCAPPR